MRRCLQVLAMARPWQEHLIRYDIAQGLRAAGIGMVLNLQVRHQELCLRLQSLNALLALSISIICYHLATKSCVLPVTLSRQHF